MEQGIFLTEQGIIFAEQGILAPEQGIGPRINFLTVRRYPTKFPLTQSRSFDRRHRGLLRPPVRDRSCRRRVAPIDWQRRGVVPIHRSRPRLHREIPSGPRVATAVRRAGSVPAPARCLPGISPRQAVTCYIEGTRAGNDSVQVPGVSELQPPGYTEHRHDRSASRTRSRFP